MADEVGAQEVVDAADDEDAPEQHEERESVFFVGEKPDGCGQPDERGAKGNDGEKEGEYREQDGTGNAGDGEADACDDGLCDRGAKDAVDDAADRIARDFDQLPTAITGEALDGDIEACGELWRIAQKEERKKGADENLGNPLADREADGDEAGAGPCEKAPEHCDDGG